MIFIKHIYIFIHLYIKNHVPHFKLIYFYLLYKYITIFFN